tara:strand:- start:90 stop:536 length:447 start_codon:yes stop_codon:yes gene_type:complete
MDRGSKDDLLNEAEERQYIVLEEEIDVSKSNTSSPSKVKQLNLSLATNRGRNSENRGDEVNIQEKNVLVVFDLPDGSQSEQYFKLGQTVEVLKSHIENEYGILMTEQALFLEDKLMLDPLSLLDYPDAKFGNELFVRVEGNLPAESKK